MDCIALVILISYIRKFVLWLYTLVFSDTVFTGCKQDFKGGYALSS